MDFDTPSTMRKRLEMVERQIKKRGITDERLIKAFLRVPRHLMVDTSRPEAAYQDSPLPIGEGQTISQPYIVALMTTLLDPQPTDRVLEVGTGSGYQTAILAELAGEIISIERLGSLAQKSRDLLFNLGYRNVTIVTGDGSMGFPDKAPFDGIIVTAHSRVIYPAWTAQLCPGGGVIVLPLGGALQQTLVKGTKAGETLSIAEYGEVVFVPLVENETND
ncbi:MAG TPA: protein-L-isoaspartate(D-aspartate) O-methyltransferase [Atribacteraceae bacterium]|nr:protein-L-isoaspartate(D-aspartate) O-methyltransferase [Atribacteraceae bacterium]